MARSSRLVFCFFVAAIGSAAHGPPKPHIVFVLTDDLGWNTAWNNNDIVSPTLNSMAAEGLKLHSHYVYRFCSPTRAAFLTGRSPYKLLNIRENLNPTTLPESTDLGFTMLPKRLQEAGYYSYQIGKWHQGISNPSFTPVARGFQESYGFLQGGEDHYTQINGRCTWGGVTDYFAQGGNYPKDGGPITSCDVPLPDRVACPLFTVIGKNESVAKATVLCAAGRFANCAFDNISDAEGVSCFQCKAKRYTGYDLPAHAVRVISKHDPKIPMFMYLALHNTHGPIQAPPEYEALYNFSQQKRNTFNAMVSVVDRAVSNVTSALKRRGMWNSTLFVWTTDNGSPVQVAGSNAPLKGGKGSDWEGGTRVPAFVSGGFLPKRMSGKTLDGIVAVWDYFATFCRLAGIDPTEPQRSTPSPVDSFDLWPYLAGDVHASPRQELVYDHLMFTVNTSACYYEGHVQVGPCNGAGAIRVGDYKLLIGSHGLASHYGHFSPNETWSADFENIHACSMDQPCLFNVSGDFAEEHDLARERPDMVRHLMQRFHAYDVEYHPPSQAPEDENERFCEAALNNGGFIQAWRSDDAETVAIV